MSEMCLWTYPGGGWSEHWNPAVVNSLPSESGLDDCERGKGDESPRKAWGTGAQQRTEEKAINRAPLCLGPICTGTTKADKNRFWEAREKIKTGKQNHIWIIHSHAQHADIFEVLWHPLFCLTPKQLYEWTGHMLVTLFYEGGRKPRPRERSHMEATESELKPVFYNCKSNVITAASQKGHRASGVSSGFPHLRAVWFGVNCWICTSLFPSVQWGRFAD